MQEIGKEATHHVCRDIFKAIHEGKWLSIEYKNKNEQITKYWIGIKDIDIRNRSLNVEGLHLGNYQIANLQCIYIASIKSSQVVEGTYFAKNEALIKDISLNPEKYRNLFDHVTNLKILNYLEDCNRMDVTPYRTNFKLIERIDREAFSRDYISLNQKQFQDIVRSFQLRVNGRKENHGKIQLNQMGINVLSIHTQKGLYVLAYRKVFLDVMKRELKQGTNITVCTEFTLDGVSKESIRRYLDADDYELLADFENNQEKIKDCIQKHKNRYISVDDMPYFIELGMDIVLDLHKEYGAIIKMYQEHQVTVPIQAFFGDLVKRPVRRKAYPFALLNKKLNLDQLLAINNAMKYPLAYIQGPPGTGKTNTIINTICTAFFNEKTVLFSSYNNHPIDGVFETLSTLKYKGKTIPFPVVRLGNQDKTAEALRYMKDIYLRTKKISVFEKTLDRNKDDRIKRAEKLSEVLKKYEETRDYEERAEVLVQLQGHYQKKQSLQNFSFLTNLKKQWDNLCMELGKLGVVNQEDAFRLLTDDEEEFRKYLYYTSAKFIKKIDEPKNKELREIIFMKDEEEQVTAFNKYLSKSQNVGWFLKIFPIVITTCISAHKIGKPNTYFDMVIMDEASQCNTAISLVPILRGKKLMLVGDPQQLNPVIILDENTNNRLKEKYCISEEYDYCKNSIYKTYLACDSVSDEVLLHYHYRCHPKIIGFNNKKYYNNRLESKRLSEEKDPLVFVNVKESTTDYRNTSPGEVEEIAKYALLNQDKSIGVITPFVNQKREIEKVLEKEGLQNVVCGTVHAFQGDEKDIVLFSTAITKQTGVGTYNWLKNNKELLNVATSRAKDKLIVLADEKNLERLHKDSKGENESGDDLYELVQYIKTNGKSEVTQRVSFSRALGVKPFSTETETAFLENLSHSMGNILLSENRFTVKKEVPISQVFEENLSYDDLFYTGRFDFVVYERQYKTDVPILAIELDGKEHYTDDVVKERDRKKNEICKTHNLELIRIENSYARRYNYIKDILVTFFKEKN